MMVQEKEYYAFISYKREDKKEAKRLQHSLEYYRLPNNLRQENPKLPEYVRPVFRDMTDLEVGELSAQLHAALEQSHFLIVVCSPRAAASKWVNDEVEYFISLGKQDKIIPYIIEGVPHASNPDEECYPPALLSLSKEKELLGANINEVGKDSATIRVVSRMFNIRFDTLFQRYEREQRRKRWMWIGGLIFLALLGLSIGGYIANQNKELRAKNVEIKEARDRANLERDRAKTANASLLIANDSIKRQYALIEQQKNELTITNNQLNQKNQELSIANTNIKHAMLESEAKRLAARSLTLLANGDSYEARKVAIHALPPFLPYTPEAELALVKAVEQNTAIIHGYSGYGISYSTNCAAFSPDGKYFATGASHEEVKLWNARSGEELLNLTSDAIIAGYNDTMTKRKCHSITFSKDGKYLLAGLSDGTARLWDMKTFKECGRFDAKREGKVTLTHSWNINYGEKTLNSHTEAPKERKDACETHAAFSHDGKFVVTSSFDGIIKIWDIKKRTLIKEINNIIHAMEDVAFSPNDKQLLIFLRTNIGGANPLTIYDLEEGDTIFTAYGNCAAFSKDGQAIAVGGYATGDINIFNIKSHEKMYTLHGHKAQVNTISFDQTGTNIVSSSNDNTIRLWHIDTSKKYLNNNKYEASWELVKTYEGHQRNVNSASFSYDGKRIVSTSDDNTIRLWDVPVSNKKTRTNSQSSNFAIYNPDGIYYIGTKDAKIKGHFFDVDIPVLYDSRTNKPIREFRGHSNDVLFATFSPNGKNFVTTSRDSTLKIWSIDADSAIYTLKGHQGSIARADYSKDGKYIVSAGCDRLIKIWDAKTGKELYSGVGHEEEVHSVSFSPNGTHIVSASIDGTVRIWNNQGVCKKILIRNPYISADVACYSPCGKYIAAGFNDGMIRIWDAFNYNELYAIKAHDIWVRYLSFSRDGKKLVSASQDKTVKIWDSLTGLELRTIVCEDIVKTASLSPNMNECLISVSGYGIKHVEIPTVEEVIDQESKRFVKSNLQIVIADNIVEQDAYAAMRIALKEIDDSVNICPEIERILRKADYARNTTIKTDTVMTFSAMFSPDGKHILTAGDFAPKIWNAENGEHEHTFNGHESLVYGASYSPNGEYVLSTGFGSTNYIWNAISGDSIHKLQGHDNIISDACFSPDNRNVLTSSCDSTAVVWDVVTGQRLYKLIGHSGIINTSIYSPDGTQILTTSDDKTAIMWDAKDGKRLFTLNSHNGKVCEGAFSPDGIIIATVSSDSTAILWDANTGMMIRRLKGHLDEIRYATYSADGKYLASVSKDHTAIVWNTETGEILNKMNRYSIEPIRPQFSPDGKILVVATVDSMVLVWDWESNIIKPLKGHNGSITSISFNHNGTTLAIASSDGQVKLWDLREYYEKTISANWGNIESISVSPTNNDIMVVENSIVNMSRYTNKYLVPIYLTSINYAQYTPDGKHVIAANDNGVINLDTNNHGDAKTISPVSSRFVSISPDGRRLLTIEDSFVVLRDKFTGNKLHKFTFGRALRSAYFSPDNNLIAVSADSTIFIFDAKNYHKKVHILLDGYANAQFSIKGNYFVSPAKNCVRIWDSSTFSEIVCLKDSGYHECVVFSPDSKFLLDVNYDNNYNSKLQIWDWAKEHIISTLNFDCQVIASYSPDGKKIVVAPINNNSIYLIDSDNHTITDTIQGTRYNNQGQTSICFSPNGQYIMAVVQEKNFKSSSIQTWDCLNNWKTSQYKIPQISFVTCSNDGKFIATIEGKNATIRDSYNGAALHVLRGHKDNVSAIAFSNNGKNVASASNDGKVIIWNASNGDSLMTLCKHLSRVNSVAFSPNGKCLATASSDKSILLWDIKNRNVIHSFNHLGAVHSVSFSTDGKYVLSATSNNSAVIWNTESGAMTSTLVGHTKSINSAYFSPDNRYVITASNDNTAIVWDVKSGQPLQTFNSINNALFDKTGKHIVGWNNNDVKFFDFPAVKELIVNAQRQFRLKK